MSWKQTISNGKAKDEDHLTPQMGSLHRLCSSTLLSNGQSKPKTTQAQAKAILEDIHRTTNENWCVTVGIGPIRTRSLSFDADV